jgi:DNA (cytosine-5)-methyltransferase 3A
MVDKLKLPSEIKGGLSVLSLFDGMSCGMLAFLKLGIKPLDYYAYEIDKYAIKTTEHNFPNIKQCGDVFEADFTQYEGIDYLIGGSPCTFWSIAQSPDKRETTASGLGWELFSQYVRALNEAKPKYFLYENNKSMSKAIYKSISNTFGFEPILINSALVSAQNRNRYYWCGKRNDDGTYSKVDIPQPEDRGILLKDILEGNDLTSCDKGWTLTTSYGGAVAWNTIERHQRNMVAEPVNTTDEGKSQTIKAQYQQTSVANICKYTSTCGASGVAEPVGTTKDEKSYCLTSGYANGSGENIGNYAAHTLEKGCKSMVAESVSPVNTTADGKAQCLRATCYKDTVRNIVGNAVPVESQFEFQDLNIRDKAHIAINENAIRGVQDKNNASCAENFYEFTDTKANTLTTAHKPKIIDELSNYRHYAEPCEWDSNGNPTKAISFADGKTYVVYSVADGQIEIKGKTYPIKLNDGYYIIRKLTVRECMRLQTVPEWYDFSAISKTQAYKCLGNGWTVDVIAHILRGLIDNGQTKETIHTI